jgi:serine/threonine protein kinase
LFSQLKENAGQQQFEVLTP